MESHGERLALLEKIPLPTSHNDVPGALDELLSRQRRRRDAASSMDYGYGRGVRDDSNASSALVPNSGLRVFFFISKKSVIIYY